MHARLAMLPLLAAASAALAVAAADPLHVAADTFRGTGATQHDHRHRGHGDRSRGDVLQRMTLSGGSERDDSHATTGDVQEHAHPHLTQAPARAPAAAPGALSTQAPAPPTAAVPALRPARHQVAGVQTSGGAFRPANPPAASPPAPAIPTPAPLPPPPVVGAGVLLLGPAGLRAVAGPTLPAWLGVTTALVLVLCALASGVTLVRSRSSG